MISPFTSNSSLCSRLSEWRGACGRRPLAGGIPRMPQSAVVMPKSATSQAYPPGFLMLYRGSVAQIVDTSTSKKNRVVMIRPGSIAAKIQLTGSVQNSTIKWVLSGEVGRKDAMHLVSIARVIIDEEFGVPLTGHRQPLLI